MLKRAGTAKLIARRRGADQWLAYASIFWLVLFGNVAFAQPSLPAKPDNICAVVPVYNERDYMPFIDAMIIPGPRLTMEGLAQTLPPETMARLAALEEIGALQDAVDWPNLCRYQTENAALRLAGKRPDIVFIGDSITQNWRYGDASVFTATSSGRGIFGQTTSQILLRFYQDVVWLRPRVVHIMAGSNDISQQSNADDDAIIIDNIRAMIDIARANNIAVVLASITPSKGFFMAPDFDPSPRIASINQSLKRLAAVRGVTYVDYFSVLVDEDSDFKENFSNDGLHPNKSGYAAMRTLKDAAIQQAQR